MPSTPLRATAPPVNVDTPASKDLWRRHQRALFPAVAPYYKEPLVIASARGVWVNDSEGNELLDAFGGILTTSLGHCHPDVVDAVSRQVAKLGHTSTLYVTEPQVLAAEQLLEIAPPSLERAFFTNSGTEAIETAIMAARIHTQRSEIVALRNAYSGRSQLASTVTAHGPWRTGFPASGIVHAGVPNTYRCPYASPCESSCVDRWIDELVEVIETTTSGRPAALMFEPIQGVGGFNVLPDDYMHRAAEVIRSYGGLLISDEVQTGFGRTGDRWWGIDHAEVAPDIMVMAKGIANGFPVGATVTTADVASSWTSKTLSTYGGNPVSMAAASATMTVMRDEEVPARSATRGAHLRRGLEGLSNQYAWIGDVRGKGLMQALEIVDEHQTPDAARTQRLLEACRDRGLLIGLGGLHVNVVRIGPSLLISEDEVEQIIARLTRACDDCA